MQIYWTLNADVFLFFSGSECGCFHSLGLFSLHGLIKVSAAQSVLYNPDVLLIMSSRATPKNFPFWFFLRESALNLKRSQVRGDRMLYFLPVTESKASKYNGGIVCCWKYIYIFLAQYALSMYSITCAWSMVFLASTIVSSQALSCYRHSCWQVGQKVWRINKKFHRWSFWWCVKIFQHCIKLSCKQKSASNKASSPHRSCGLMTWFIHILSNVSHGNFSKCHQLWC